MERLGSVGSAPVEDTDRVQRSKRALPESLFRTRLIEEVHRKLQKAVDSSSQKQELLRQLFTDVALEVDNRARGLLYGDIKASDPLASSTGGKSSLCFYEVLAQHYVQQPGDGEALLPLFNNLWSLSFTSQLFAVILHQWNGEDLGATADVSILLLATQLFQASAAHADQIQRYSRAFINGMGETLWIDVQSNANRFLSLYEFVVYDVVLVPERLSTVPPQPQKDLAQLVSRFFFFYEPANQLGYLLRHLPDSISNAFIGGPADIYVTELTNQLQKIKIEPVLLQYLEATKALKGTELRTTTSIRLQVALYSMASPGGPLFPTRAVRHSAKAALDHLFPVGRRFRNLISLGFRLLHPAYWPGSFFNFFLTTLKTLYDWSARFWRVPSWRARPLKARAWRH